MQRQSFQETIGRAISGGVRQLRKVAGRLGGAAEWNALDAEQRRQLASDIGTTSADLDWAVRSGEDGIELNTLLARPALRHLRYSLDVLRDMQRVCTFCPRHKRCRSWQANAGPVVRWPAFCPNGHTFASLQRSEGSRPAFGALP